VRVGVEVEFSVCVWVCGKLKITANPMSHQVYGECQYQGREDGRPSLSPW
jgi:hypothetical protein